MTRTLAIIINHNLPGLTDRLYEQLESQPRSQRDLMVLDNGSRPELQSKYTTTRIPENTLYGGGLNRAFEMLLADDKYDSLLLLNNDLILETEDLVGGLRAGLEAGYTIISPVINGDCSWPQMHDWNSGGIRTVDWVDFMCPLFHRRFVEHVRAFDGSLHWGYGQDLLSGLVCRRAGWRMGVTDLHSVHHLGKQTWLQGVTEMAGRTVAIQEYRANALRAMRRYFVAIGRLSELMRMRNAAFTYRYDQEDGA